MFGFLLCLVIFVGVLVKYVAPSYSPAVSAVLQLFRKGCVHFTGLEYRPQFAIKGVRISQSDGSKEAIFQCARIVLTSSIWEVLTGQQFNIVVQQAEVNCLIDDTGLLHVVRLLQDVGYLEETRAAKRPEAVTGEERVKVTQYEIVRPTFAADFRVLTARILLPDGIVVLPAEAGAVLGNEAIVYVAVGAANIRKHVADVKEASDASWLDTPPVPPPEANVGPLSFPLLAEVKSTGMQASLQCWRTKAGLLLHEPVQARLRLTPALTKCCLAKITPMLKYVADIKDGKDIVCTLTPLHMHWPCETISLRFEPMRLYMHCHGLLKTLLHIFSRDHLELIRGGALEAWTSGVEAQWWREGFIETRRMDIVIGLDLKNTRRVHFAMWGQVDTAHDNATEMTVGLPADTLAAYGIKNLPENYMLDIKVTGTTTNPQVDVPRVVAKLGKLTMRAVLDNATPILQMFNRFGRKSGSQHQLNPGKPTDEPQASSQLLDTQPPPPTLPLPWDAFHETEPADKPLS